MARAALVAVTVLTACCCRGEEKDQILFLHLKLKDDAVTLVRSSVKPGRLKTPFAPDKKGDIHLELTTAEGLSLWSDVMADPTVQRVEYEDPENPGTLKVKEIRVTEVEFTVRVPFHKEGKQFRLHRLNKPASRADATAAGRVKKLLGAVAIPVSGVAP
jgi:hypothetical protein